MASNDSYFMALENRGLDKVKTQWSQQKHGRPGSKNWHIVKAWIEQEENNKTKLESQDQEALKLKQMRHSMSMTLGMLFFTAVAAITSLVQALR
ncbi:MULTISPECIES: hypothetical protein [Vibrio]|uniref:Uncharacterized protein n=1 Tax=Vibrio splendidus TaxID=29497 RepID=A0ABV4M003_VIBSP|nr:hypothetical protein [Vibrio splendidus]PTP37958.1 hypothetical protein CWN95_02055 [Vibrio splendidus]